MSKDRLKTTYKTEGPYGTEEEHTLFVTHNYSTDYVTFYDSNGEWLLAVPDTIDNNVLDAINKLYNHNGIDLAEGVEQMTKEDIDKCRNNK